MCTMVYHIYYTGCHKSKKSITGTKKVVNGIERRYELFSASGTRNIEVYNEHIRKHNAETGEKQPLLPFIIVIVDELADLMMVPPSDVGTCDNKTCRQWLVQLVFYLIIATQSPVDVITNISSEHSSSHCLCCKFTN